MTQSEVDEDRFDRAPTRSSDHDLSTIPWESWQIEGFVEPPPDVAPFADEIAELVSVLDVVDAPNDPLTIDPSSESDDLEGLAEVPWYLWALDHPCEAERAEAWLRSNGASLAAGTVDGTTLFASSTTARRDEAGVTPWMLWALDHPCEAERAEAWLDEISATGEPSTEQATAIDGSRRRAGTSDEASTPRWRRVVSAVVTTALAVALVGVVFLGYGKLDNRWYQLVTVQGGSMEPTYSIGDVLVLTRPPDQIEVGMVLTLQVEGSVVTHRVIEFADDGTFVTQGDANDFPDDFSGLDVRVVGQVRGAVPWIGKYLSTRGSTNAWFTDRAILSASASAGIAFTAEGGEDANVTPAARTAIVPAVPENEGTESDDKVLDDTVSDDTVTDDTVADDTVSDDTVTEETVADDMATDDTVADDTATDDTDTDDADTAETVAAVAPASEG